MATKDAQKILAELGLDENLEPMDKTQKPRPKQMPTGEAPVSNAERAKALLAEIEGQELADAPQSGFGETEASKSARQSAVGVAGMALPAAATALGIAAGPFAAPVLRMGASGAKLLGGMLGGAAGEAANQSLGITEPNPLAVGLNALAPLGGRALATGIQHFPRLLPNSASAIRAGLVERAEEAPGKHIIAPDSQALYKSLPKAGEPGSFRVTDMPRTKEAIKALRDEDTIVPIMEKIERKLEGDPVTYRTVKWNEPYHDIEQTTTKAKLPYTVEGTRTSESEIVGPGQPGIKVGKATIHGPNGTTEISDKWPNVNTRPVPERTTEQTITNPTSEVKYRTTTANIPKVVTKYRDHQATLPVAPKDSPGYEFQEAVNMSERLGALIRDTQDGPQRGAYRKLYRSVLEDLESMPAPAGEAVDTWAKARASYRKEIAKGDLAEVIEKASAPKRGVPQLNADQVLKFIQQNKEFRKRLDPKELAGLEKDFTNMASFTGPGSNKLLTILLGSTLAGGTAGGAMAGYVAADVLSAALLHPGTRRVLTKFVTAKGGKAGQDAGAILAAALTGSLGNDPNYSEDEN